MQHMSEELLFDIRLAKRHLDKGLITQEQIDARIAQLEDLQEQCEPADANELDPMKKN